MKKKNIKNLVMILIITVIVVVGVFTVGSIRGWFDKAEDSAILTDIKGIITVEREGVAFNVEKDTSLRERDVVRCASGATVKIVFDEGFIVLGEGAEISIENPLKSSLKLLANSGEGFIRAGKIPVLISLAENEMEIKNTITSFSVRKGAQSLLVFNGEIDDVSAGQLKEWVGAEAKVRDIDINSLNDFNISMIKSVQDNYKLCFSKEDIEKLEAKRLAEKEAVAKAARTTDNKQNIKSDKKNGKETKKDVTTSVHEPETTDEPEITTEKTALKDTEKATEKVSEKTTEKTTAKPVETEDKKTEEESKRKSEEESRKAAEEESRRLAEEESKKAAEEANRKYATITIRCDTILSNWDNLDQSKTPFVPGDGCILGSVQVEFTEGETVFDVLNRVCTDYGIQIEYSWTPMYDSYYIEGINHLYEFDCGAESGWIYKVNGWFPNYGCSSYTLQNGDDIAWLYTCEGLGTDVGAPSF